jgi:phospholipid/cholesterol/gamma-HCH transport system substrate-binding protein
VDSTLASTNKIVDEQNRREIKLLLANLNKTIEDLKQPIGTNAILASNENGLHEVLAMPIRHY